MTDKQPEALRIADALDELDLQFYSTELLCDDAAAELRRLHEESQVSYMNGYESAKGEYRPKLQALEDINAELVVALEFCAGASYITDAHDVAKAALAKATGEQQ